MSPRLAGWRNRSAELVERVRGSRGRSRQRIGGDGRAQASATAAARGCAGAGAVGAALPLADIAGVIRAAHQARVQILGMCRLRAMNSHSEVAAAIEPRQDHGPGSSPATADNSSVKRGYHRSARQRSPARRAGFAATAWPAAQQPVAPSAGSIAPSARARRPRPGRISRKRSTSCQCSASSTGASSRARRNWRLRRAAVEQAGERAANEAAWPGNSAVRRPGGSTEH